MNYACLKLICVDEILLSNDKTIAVIDGSGVLADPAGIDREELRRLASLRVAVSHFDRSKLSRDGYIVLVEDQDIKLPCKEQCKAHSTVSDDSAFSW